MGRCSLTPTCTCLIPASSGKTELHRLNCGGDRRLDRAINTVVLNRMCTDQDTWAYIQLRSAEGKSGLLHDQLAAGLWRRDALLDGWLP